MDWLDRGLHSLSQVNFAVPAAAGSFPQYHLTPQVLTNAIALSATTGMCLQGWLKTKSALRATGPSTSSSSSASFSSTPSSSAAAAPASSAVVPSVKFVSSGLAASRGVESLVLARVAGITGPCDALESMLHFFSPPPSPRKPDRELQAFRLLGSVWTLDRHLVKQYAAQFNLQAAISCALELHGQGLRLGDLRSLVVRGHSFVCGVVVQGCSEAFRPTSQGSADHSAPFVVVMSLLAGSFSPHAAYAREPWLREDLRQHMRKITLVIDEGLETARMQGRLGCNMTATKHDGQRRTPHGSTLICLVVCSSVVSLMLFACCTCAFGAGTVLSCEQLTTLGHPDAPLSDAQLLSKWDSLLTPLYGRELAQRLWQACSQLQNDSTSGAGGALQALEDLLCTQPLASSSSYA